MNLPYNGLVCGLVGLDTMPHTDPCQVRITCTSVRDERAANWIIQRVVEYIEPAAFDRYKEIALEKGFRHVASGPLVRSSYHAADFKPELDPDA